VDAVYVAVPHNLHQEFYRATLESGKHLMGEKPFGIDREANRAILDSVRSHPECFVRCASQFIFFSGMQRIGRFIEQGSIGKIIEVKVGFLHSSDLNTSKPVNWKRRIATNGEYGSMGDLGMHACLLPIRAGWRPRRVFAVLSNIVPERPDGQGGTAACETWDNAVVSCEAECQNSGDCFPMTLRTHRIAPGEKNSLYVEILGTQTSVRWSTKRINTIEILEYNGGEQAWQQIDLGHETAFQSITGGIFEMGFSDAILQMWASYIQEMTTGQLPNRFAGCATPEETAVSHELFTAAIQSQREGCTMEIH
jgi:predicted dehydrogenase